MNTIVTKNNCDYDFFCHNLAALPNCSIWFQSATWVQVLVCSHYSMWRTQKSNSTCTVFKPETFWTSHSLISLIYSALQPLCLRALWESLLDRLLCNCLTVIFTWHGQVVDIMPSSPGVGSALTIAGESSVDQARILF